MTFQTLFNQFENLSSGTDAFKQLKIACEQNIIENQNPSENIAYYLIYGFAKTYVLLYEDQAVSSAFAEKAKTQLLDYMQQINQALLLNESEVILKTLNQISEHYMQSDRIF